MNSSQFERDQYFRRHKWGLRVIQRGSDCDVALVAKCLGFPDEQVIARGLWPSEAHRLCDEHNNSLAMALFEQKS